MPQVLRLSWSQVSFFWDCVWLSVFAKALSIQGGRVYCLDVVLKAVIHKAQEGGYWAEVPALPGCRTQGESEEEVLKNLREAVELWLEAGDEVANLAAGEKVLELVV